MDSIFLALSATTSVAGAVSTGAGILILPAISAGLGFVALLSRGAQLFPGKYMKSKEMTYLSSACLGFVNSIMQDVLEMNQFYGLDIVKTKYQPDPATYNVLQQNLYKFMHFLIRQINFETVDEANEKQDAFWVGMFKKVYFKDYNFRSENGEMKKNPPPVDAPKAILFRYSFKDCIPDAMRKKLRLESLMGITEKDAVKNNYDLLKLPTTDQEKAAYTTKKDQECKLAVADCNNYNDFLMQMLEYKAHKLIKAQYKRFKNNFKFNIFTDNLNDDASKTRLRENYKKYLSSQKRYILLRQFTDAMVERMIAFNFPNLIAMIEVLKRFIAELEVNEKDLLSFYNFRDNSRIEKAEKAGSYDVTPTSGYMVGGGNKTDMLMGSPVQNYREMLREYTIMTANFGLVTARYNIHCNKLMLEDGVTSADYKTSVAKFMDERKITKPEVTAALTVVVTESNNTVDALNSTEGNETLDLEQSSSVGGKTRRKQKYRPRRKIGSTRRR